ncbi:hypothetical protein [Paramicrobacterium humi]|uniref:hypothetical protein n=1 Tax=Paramicrobacterium humi TaxID=640635 RepID=UPI00115FFDEC|nr:hypothetical protein [Microbacterium humi]
MGNDAGARLQGGDGEVRAVAREALAVLRRDDARAGGILSGIERLARARRVTPTRGGAVFFTLLGIGLVAAVVSGALAGPPGKRIMIDPATAVPALMAAGIVAVLALAAALARGIHRPVPSDAGVILSVIVALIVAGIAVYRLVVGPSGGTAALPPSAYVLWLAGAAVIVMELVVIAGVLRRAVRSRDAAFARGRPDREPSLRAQAEELAQKDRALSVRTRADWEAALAELQSVPTATIEQARLLGPIGWLAWAAYGRRIDPTELAPHEGGAAHGQPIP